MTFDEFLDEWRGDAGHIEVNTSGSTGTPKSIKLDKEFVKQSALRTIDFFSITNGSTLHSCISPDFIGGKMTAVRADLAGCKFSWETPSNQPLKKFSPKDVIDMVSVVPSQMLYILDHQQLLPRVKTFLIGGGAISPLLRERIVQSGLNAFESYGMTETASHIALRKVSCDDPPFNTLPGITVETDSRGCLAISFSTGERFMTNDIAQILSPEEFRIKGRIDNVIITGGKKINAEEIESKLSSFIPYPFIITGIPDEKWGQKITLLIEAANNLLCTDIGRSQLIEKMRERLPAWQIPKEIRFVEKLSRTPNGKLIRSDKAYGKHIRH